MNRWALLFTLAFVAAAGWFMFGFLLEEPELEPLAAPAVSPGADPAADEPEPAPLAPSADIAPMEEPIAAATPTAPIHAPPVTADLPVPGTFDLATRGDLRALQTKLAEFLVARGRERASTAASPAAALDDLLSDRTYLHALAQHELIRSTGATNAAAVRARPDGALFLAGLLNDRELLEEYLASGPAPEQTEDGLDALRRIWLSDAGSPQWPQQRKLAAAVALGYGTDPFRNGLQGLRKRSVRPLQAEERYAFYRDSQAAGRLHPLFNTLDTWTLRFVVGHAVENEALAWAQDNVHIPLQRYVDACWMVEYRGASDFGDDIQGPLFYAGWQRDQNWMQYVQDSGGVCGSLSTFGARSAAARGIPAYTCGQPGHCAYAVRTAPGTWSGGFGGPDGGPHLHFWRGNYAYIRLMEDALSNSVRRTGSARRAWQARLYRERDTAAARMCYERALDANPLDYSVWRDYVTWLKTQPAAGRDEWVKLTQRVLSSFGPHCRPMVELLGEYEKDKLLPTFTDDQRLAWFLRVQRAITNRPASWSWNIGEDVLGRQVNELPKDGPQRFNLYRFALGIHADSAEGLGQVLDWGVKQFGQTPEGSAKCIMALVDALKREGDGLTDAQLHKTLNSAILSAAKSKSLPAFHAASELAARFAKPGEGSIELPKLPGVLVSSNALLYASSSAYDDPANHRGVLRESGGLFHTDSEKDPWVIVQLPRTCALSGLVVVNRLGANEYRTKRLKVSISKDGATWFPVGATDDFQKLWKLDLLSQRQTAAWVKIEAPREEAEHFHLRNILVYGKPLS
jgi:hypothetical protein